MVRKVDAKTRIGLVPFVPPAGSQDAFGANYGCMQTRWQYKRNQHRVVERLIEQCSADSPLLEWAGALYRMFRD